MKTKIAKKFIKIVTITVCLVLMYGFYLIEKLFYYFYLLFRQILIYLDVFKPIPAMEANEDTLFEPKYTDAEIEVMAKKLPNDDYTIDEISDFYGVSYRQARKIKTAVKNALTIHKRQIA